MASPLYNTSSLARQTSGTSVSAIASSAQAYPVDRDCKILQKKKTNLANSRRATETIGGFRSIATFLDVPGNKVIVREKRVTRRVDRTLF